MTRKDYELLADALAEVYGTSYVVAQTQKEKQLVQYGVAMAGQAIAERLAKDNPRFDTARFLIASETGSRGADGKVLGY